jgi:hypothetical protein
MITEMSFRDVRAMLSMFAVSLAVVYCHTLRHFTISLSHPSTWSAATLHHCGRFLIATVLWFVCEVLFRLVEDNLRPAILRASLNRTNFV